MSVERSRSLGTIEESGLSDVPQSNNHSNASIDDTRVQPAPPDSDEDDEEFVYPGGESDAHQDVLGQESGPVDFLEAPAVPPNPLEVPELPAPTPSTPLPIAPVLVQEEPTRPLPSAAQLEELYSAATAGDLYLLQTLFQSALSSGNIEVFALANSASPRTGLTPLHAAASRGHKDVLQWLIESCGAMPDLEDKEGETALHKAALNGHLPIVRFLLELSNNAADVHAQDGDGWTALHNACSKGYLDIVRYLCEHGAVGDVMNPLNGLLERGVDRRSKGGWTPLMNAASKGNLPVVLYLLSKHRANPMVRNNWGETAYDIAAAVFEVWICEVLQKAEADQWQHSPASYDPLAVHTTVPLILHENQHLDTRLKTLASSGGKPVFTTSGLGRKGRHSPFELRLPHGDDASGKKDIPAWRSDVQLPLSEDPFTLPKPKATREPSSRGEGAERSHFWLSDWTLDLTHPRVDVNEGWQYAHAFDDPDDQWSAEPPPLLDRLLSGGAGVLSPAITGNISASTSRGTPATSAANAASWVRRRRWVRVMRRRLDIPPLPFLEPDGKRYYLGADGGLIPAQEYEEAPLGVGSYGSGSGSEEGQELGNITSRFGAHSKDYVSHARYLAGSQRGENVSSGDEELSRADLKRAISRLGRAVMELRTGMLGDENAERKTQAEVLLNAYDRELERLRLKAGASGIFVLDTEQQAEEDEGESSSSDESFHYPMASSPTSTARPSSIRSHATNRTATDYFTFNFGNAAASTSSGSTSRRATAADLTPHLAQSPEFRVPTHEAPQKVVTPRWTPPTPHSMHAVWERDEAARDCRNCRRRFTFLLRKHHCRRCGKIFCDRCSQHRVLLDPSDLVLDPSYADVYVYPSTVHRVCDNCYEQTTANVPGRFQGARTGSLERIVVESASLLHVPRSRNDSTSQISDLADCPVCSQNLAEIGPPAVQEAHVKNCLDGPGGGVGPNNSQAGRYLVYKLPAESTLIGVECVICLEEFVKGTDVARLSCFCTFHNTCLSAWLQRGRSCPVHARDT